MSDLGKLHLKCYKYNNVKKLQSNDKISDFDVEINAEKNVFMSKRSSYYDDKLA